MEEVIACLVTSEFGSLAAGKRDSWFAITVGTTVDATKQSVRANFIDIFPAGATRTALAAVGVRAATRFENLFVTSGVTSVFGYLIDEQDITLSLSS